MGPLHIAGPVRVDHHLVPEDRVLEESLQLGLGAMDLVLLPLPGQPAVVDGQHDLPELVELEQLAQLVDAFEHVLLGHAAPGADQIAAHVAEVQVAQHDAEGLDGDGGGQPPRGRLGRLGELAPEVGGPGREDVLVQGKVLGGGREGDVGGRGRLADEQRGDVGGPGLQGVGSLGVVVRQQQVPDLVGERVVDGSFPLKRVRVGQRPWGCCQRRISRHRRGRDLAMQPMPAQRPCGRQQQRQQQPQQQRRQETYLIPRAAPLPRSGRID